MVRGRSHAARRLGRAGAAIKLLYCFGIFAALIAASQRGRSLDGPLMASFEKERDRLDAMMNSRGGVARLSDAADTAGVRQISNR